jgi:hypothetical protein
MMRRVLHHRLHDLAHRLPAHHRPLRQRRREFLRRLRADKCDGVLERLRGIRLFEHARRAVEELLAGQELAGIIKRRIKGEEEFAYLSLEGFDSALLSDFVSVFVSVLVSDLVSDLLSDFPFDAGVFPPRP